MDENAIVLEDVTVKFNLYKENISGFKEYIIKKIKRELISEQFLALNGISLTIKKGDVVGLLGFNGAGKSTLLKTIAGVLQPTYGKVITNGKIAPLIELGAGFDMELTARENIYLNGAILGYSRRFLNEKFEEIIDFAEIEEFLDVPLKNYSSGMVARIGFSIATMVKPEILIIDEILSVGDYKFQEKCEKRIKMMLDDQTTVIIVSHSIQQIRDLCNKAIFINRGKILTQGDVESVCDQYMLYES
ncbi:ABC transporter ATP-binding protein [Paenibacillus chitinolyticus]|uniref:ABC transporter ATP-binding protein n=1 Tax=Paenibacillus chitinolyticus TaxID=79263 RepID=UPI002DBC8211|nr:ABC transporter ATP-binding protein [Paenibacillus chitinolyticus]MEC0245084.1 ABC transporter ATP-binding protein [Paenibacillus chitinolyticus]